MDKKLQTFDDVVSKLRSTFEEDFDEIVSELRKIYEAKNKDYGDSFSISAKKWGILAYAIRAGDKMLRIEQLVSNKPNVVDESIEDTIRDLANYSIMALMWINAESEDDGVQLKIDCR